MATCMPNCNSIIIVKYSAFIINFKDTWSNIYWALRERCSAQQWEINSLHQNENLFGFPETYNNTIKTEKSE